MSAKSLRETFHSLSKAFENFDEIFESFESKIGRVCEEELSSEGVSITNNNGNIAIVGDIKFLTVNGRVLDLSEIKK
jgi:hypothetical protein